MTSQDIAPAQANGYALETRAETLKVVTAGNAVRRGDTEELHAGEVEHFSDAVYGEERTTLRDTLEESTEGGSTTAAKELELTVHGRLSVTAAGWPENKLSGEDVILLIVRDLGGNVGDGDLERLYVELQRLRSQAVLDDDVLRTQKIDRFLDWYHLKVYDASTNLAGRADEFNQALTGAGGMQLLDPDVDRGQLQKWLEEQRDVALARLNQASDLNDSQIETLGREFPYYHQLWLALEEGRDPLVDRWTRSTICDPSTTRTRSTSTCSTTTGSSRS